MSINNERKVEAIYMRKLIIAFLTALIIFSAAGCSKFFSRLSSPNQIPQVEKLSFPGTADVSYAAGKVIPSVVGITIIKTEAGRTIQGVGSGIIVDSGGYIPDPTP